MYLHFNTLIQYPTTRYQYHISVNPHDTQHVGTMLGTHTVPNYLVYIYKTIWVDFT